MPFCIVGFELLNAAQRFPGPALIHRHCWGFMITMLQKKRPAIFPKYIAESYIRQENQNPGKMKKKLRQLISKEKVEQVLQLLQEITEKLGNENLRDEALLQSSNYERYAREKRLGTSNSEDQNVAIARINQGLMHIINKLPDEWPEKNYPATEGTEAPLEEKDKLPNAPLRIEGNYHALHEGEKFLIKCSNLMTELESTFSRAIIFPVACDRAEGRVESLITDIPASLHSNYSYTIRRLLPELAASIRRFRSLCSFDSPESEKAKREIQLKIEELLKK